MPFLLIEFLQKQKLGKIYGSLTILYLKKHDFCLTIKNLLAMLKTKKTQLFLNK